MARPIRETPILQGKDAIRFEEAIHNVKQVSTDEKNRMKKVYEKFTKIATFNM